MRIAIISDIHGNLEALQSVLERCAGMHADRVVCLGDMVGYGADPNACIAKVRAVAETVLAGNHDRAAVSLRYARNFNPAALAAIRWTAAELSKDHVAYLEGRPLTVQEDMVLYAHASPDRPDTFPYIRCPNEGRMCLVHTNARICFVGHSHHAFICSEGGDVEILGEGSVKVEASLRYLVNAGSVGQPRDRDPRAAFVMWDRADDEMHLCRVCYDISLAQAKIRDAGLPGILAERLAVGR